MDLSRDNIALRRVRGWMRLPVPKGSPEGLQALASTTMPGLRANFLTEPIGDTGKAWLRLVLFAEGRRPTWDELTMARYDFFGGDRITLTVFPPANQELPENTVTLLQPYGWGDELINLSRLEADHTQIIGSEPRAAETETFRSNAGDLRMVVVAGPRLPSYEWLRALKDERFGRDAFGFWPWYPDITRMLLADLHIALWSLPGIQTARQNPL